MIRFPAFVLGIVAVVACVQKPIERDFPRVTIPSMIENPQERMEYAVLHFFDGFADTSAAYLCDSTHYGGVLSDKFEYEFSSWMMMLHNVDRQRAYASIERGYAHCASALNGFIACCEKYMFDPNSPVRDEDFYGVLAGLRLSDPRTPQDKLTKIGYDTRLCALNRVGTPAADFSFTDKFGKVRRLYDVKASVTVLIFSNPGCTACKEIIEAFEASPKLRGLTASGTVQIVNIFPDENLESWFEYLPNYPAEWICGHDSDGILRSESLYSLRAIPSIYVLDAKKTVVLKDCPTGRMLEFVESL